MKVKAGIQNKILGNTAVIVLTMAIVLVLVMVFFMWSLTGSMLSETLQPIAKLASQSVEGNLHLLVDRVVMISENPALVDDTVPPAGKQALLDGAKSGIEFVWLALYSADGRLYTGSAGSPSSIAQSGQFELLQQTANVVIDDTHSTDAGLQIVVGVPIADAKQNIRYYLIGSYKYDVLNDVLSNITVGKTGIAFIVNQDGRLMAHPDGAKVSGQETFYDLFGDSDTTRQIAGQMAQGMTGTFEMGSLGSKRYFSYSPVRGTLWSLVVTAPQSDFMAAANRAIVVSLGITALLLVFAAMTMVRLSRRLQRPLGRVTNRISTLAQGDLHTAVEIEKTRDETETLSQALANTVTSINSYTSELSRVLSELSQSNLDVSVNGDFNGDFIVMKQSLNQIVDFFNQIMQAIQQSAVEVADTSRRIEQNALQVEQGSSGQAESLSRLHDATLIINANVEEIDAHTELMRRFVDKANDGMSVGQARMDDMLSAINRIRSDSEEIQKINQFMEDIALQTNLLALNASIEAAHAGAAGSGFAVVAREIGDLAAKSGQSSRQTASIIENSQRAILDGVRCAAQTAESLGEIVTLSTQISEVTGNLSEALAAEKTALEHITQQMGEINQLAQGNLDSSRESAHASRTLTRQAHTLQNMVKRFRLRQAGGRL